MIAIAPGDCLTAMREAFEDDTFDAIVTDPPYGLEFMGKGWDHGVPGAAFWTEALRIAKPGAHLVAFGGTRTYHRLACAIEDAGWEVRDCLSWLYGSGFPKSLDVSKAIDKAAGAEREVVGRRTDGRYAYGFDGNAARPTGGRIGTEDAERIGGFVNEKGVITAPATDAARQWQGWGTALKPAWEPIILARKPLVGTVAANVLAHGTGALNIDGCRIGLADGEVVHAPQSDPSKRAGEVGRDLGFTGNDPEAFRKSQRESIERTNTLGRWPANVALDEEAAAMLDEQSGEGKSQGRRVAAPKIGFGMKAQPEVETGYGDSGGASRFFYTAKASRRERGEGNTHPTVKPLSLMRWLAKLVTPPGGVILDPFAGSGTTLLAAQAEGFDAVGIEREAEYVEIIKKRLGDVGVRCVEVGL